MSNVTVDLERQTEPCCDCDSDDEQLVAVVSVPGIKALHFCLSCACSLNNKVERLLREVPPV